MIVVIGVTGNTGQQLLRELAARRQRVRAGARNPQRARQALAAAGVPLERVEFATCDVADPSTFEATLEGAERCYVAIGGPTGSLQLLEQARRLVDAAKRSGVRHYVHVSGINARPTGASKIEQLHGAFCEYLEGSGLPFTILEPSFFMQNFLGLGAAIRAGVLPLPTGEARAGLIDARDIAAVAAEVLTSDGHLGQRYVLTGPELLSHREVAAQMSRVLERPVHFQDVPGAAFEQAVTQAGAPPWFANLLTDAYEKLFKPGTTAVLSDTVARLTGRSPRSLVDFLRDHRTQLGVPG